MNSMDSELVWTTLMFDETHIHAHHSFSHKHKHLFPLIRSPKSDILYNAGGNMNVKGLNLPYCFKLYDIMVLICESSITTTDDA